MTRRAPVLALVFCCAACSDKVADEPAVAPGRATPAGVAVVTGKAAPGTIVTLEPSAARDVEAPAGTVLMDQFGQQFLPDLLAIRAGQRVEFRSSEDVLHNVRVDNLDTDAPLFNVATPPFESYTHAFESPGYYRVSCDVHPAMRANIFVAATPYVTLVNADGSFTLPDVPAGAYTVRAMDGGKTSEKAVNVTAPRTELVLTPDR